MPSEFDGSVVAIVRADSRELLGTGFVISPSLVLTCAHFFVERKISQDGQMQLATDILVLFGDSALHPSQIYESRPVDLCCLRFPEIPGAVPIQMVRSIQLQEIPVTTVGFVPDQIVPRRHVAHGLKVIHELRSEEKGWLQFAQLQGGAPKGFSGGPVLARIKDGWRAVGMLQLGTETAPISRFIAADPIALCLAEHNLSVRVGEFQPEISKAQVPDVHPAPSQTVRIGSIDKSKVNVSQNQIFERTK